MSRVVALVVALLLSPAFVARSGAAALAPKRASDLRTVSTSRHSCPDLLLGIAVDMVQNPDGTTAPFVVPPGSVFIVTSWEWVDCAGTPDGFLPVVSLEADNGVTLTRSFLGLSAGTTTSANGRTCYMGAVQTPGGVAMNSSATLCVSDINASIVVHGFITRDN